MKKRKKKKENANILRVGFLLLFISILLLAILQILKSYRNSKDNLQRTSSNEVEHDVNGGEDKKTSWSEYKNDDYLISFDYPYLLHGVEYEEPGEYEYFIVFEESQFSKEKGVAFGVSSGGLEKEIERIKSSVSKEGGSRLIKDEKYAGCLDSWILEYEPEDESLEARSFFIFEGGDYTYSFSTVPEQIQRLINSIAFTS